MSVALAGCATAEGTGPEDSALEDFEELWLYLSPCDPSSNEGSVALLAGLSFCELRDPFKVWVCGLLVSNDRNGLTAVVDCVVVKARGRMVLRGGSLFPVYLLL